MPISLESLRDELFPGIAAVSGRYRDLYGRYRDVYAFTPAAPHIWVPKLTLPEMALIGAAAAVIQNPAVTRRFWTGWLH